MIVIFKGLYELAKANEQEFIEKGLQTIQFIDVYRGQTLEPEIFEYYPMPAMFVDYEMQGQGHNKPRLITLTLHIVTDEMDDASSIADFDSGLKRFLYHGILQNIIEGAKLGGVTTALSFVSENLVEEAVVNYHTQVYQFEAYANHLTGSYEELLGFIEEIKLQGQLKKSLD